MPTKHDLFSLIRQTSTKLTSPHINQPEQEAWWLIEAILNKKRAILLASREHTISAKQLATLDNYIARRTTKHEPLQYILGHVPFCDLKIKITPPTLIPRPETEEWVSRLIQELSHIPYPISILDLCTGSGCIALALASKLPSSHITATDISPKAIKLAQANQKELNITNLTFIEADLFPTTPEKFDVIVANPPYLSQHEYDALEPSVRLWEDKSALTPGPSGLEIYTQIIQQTTQHLNPAKKLPRTYPQLILEIGHKQHQPIKTLMQQHLTPTIWYDTANKARVIVGRRF